MDKNRAFVVVIGRDQKGIIARISTLLFENGINIEDLQQKVMDGTFVMTLLADLTDSPKSTAELRKSLDEIGTSMGLTIMLHQESVVNAMHRV